MSRTSREAPEDTPLAVALRRSTLRLARRLRAQRPRDGVSLTQLQVLGHLYRNGPSTAGELAQHEQLLPQSLTRLLAALEREGWIAREQNLADRRQFLVSITEDGRKQVRRDMRARDTWLVQTVNERLSASEKALLADAVNLIERLADPD